MRRALALAAAGLVALGLGLGIGRATAPDGDDGHAEVATGTATLPGPSDVGFAQDMAVHHDQALQMARLVRGRVDPRIDAIAAQIVEVQTRETGMLRGWLALWGSAALNPGAPMAWMGDHADHGAEPDGGDGATPPMPGMASTDEMAALETLEGTELEVHFLQLMVRHHRGGIEMAGAGADAAVVPAVVSAAQLMATEQQQEVSLMLALLDERDAAELPL